MLILIHHVCDHLDLLWQGEPPRAREVVQKHRAGGLVLLRVGTGAGMQSGRLQCSLKEQVEKGIQTRNILSLAKGTERNKSCKLEDVEMVAIFCMFLRGLISPNYIRSLPYSSPLVRITAIMLLMERVKKLTLSVFFTLKPTVKCIK